MTRRTEIRAEQFPGGHILLSDYTAGRLLISYQQALKLALRRLGPEVAEEDVEPYLLALYENRNVLGIDELLSWIVVNTPLPYALTNRGDS